MRLKNQQNTDGNTYNVQNYFNCKMVYLVHNKMRAHSAIININIGLKRAMHCPAANHAHAR